MGALDRAKEITSRIQEVLSKDKELKRLGVKASTGSISLAGTKTNIRVSCEEVDPRAKHDEWEAFRKNYDLPPGAVGKVVELGGDRYEVVGFDFAQKTRIVELRRVFPGGKKRRWINVEQAREALKTAKARRRRHLPVKVKPTAGTAGDWA